VKKSPGLFGSIGFLRDSSEFANGGFAMVATDVVPFDSVGVKVVEDSDANLVAVTIVGLWLGLGLFPSSWRPEPLSSDVSLLLARWPGDGSDVVCDPSTGPKVSPPVTDGNVDELERLFVVVQRDGASSLQLAVLVGLLAGEVGALVLVDLVRQNVLATLRIHLVGAGARATIKRGAWSATTDGRRRRPRGGHVDDGDGSGGGSGLVAENLLWGTVPLDGRPAERLLGTLLNELRRRLLALLGTTLLLWLAVELLLNWLT